MSLLKSINFIAIPKSVASDPKIARRQKLLTQLRYQRALAEDSNFVVKHQKWVKGTDGGKALIEAPKRLKRWWHTDAVGNCYLILRFGNKIIAPSPDKAAIAVGDKSKLIGILDMVIAAAESGELDAPIDMAMNAPRTPKKKTI